ncbi:prolyl 4-hydroxylase subunit alpha-1-like [Toxorhynchites rutilus septentrionalis]|uniref:prolyl 4-hydroxylase subunit alpha-1-like n=1 Tax=Toxorhynchites rutilus septentrionalis TaxID=329112 RepID=UPI00247858A9|nr:prolyl 4-hydroxylase subunit alpha-1-like [Toxorhynchites rutilus septentrionalis]
MVAVRGSASFLLLGSCWLLLVGATPAKSGHSEFYTSVTNMAYLVESEQHILQRLDKYIRLAEEKIRFLRRQKEKLMVDIGEALADKVGYVSNPINAFLLTRRFLVHYRKLDELMQMGLGVQLIDDSSMVPSDADYNGVVEALGRLQETYQLDTAELAGGKIRGRTVSRELTAEECYKIGAALSKDEGIVYATSWLREALRRWTLGDTSGVSKSEILAYLSYTIFMDGNYEEALSVVKQLLKLDPTHEEGLKRKETIENWLKYVEVHGPAPRSVKPEWSLYKPLCRGEHQRPVAESSMLRCRYERSKSPFIRIAPFKLEELSLDPLIVLYHDVVSDGEIKQLIVMGKPLLKRSMVGEGPESREISTSRTSQNSWLKDYDHPVVQRLTLRAADMSGLNMRAAEELQVNNYGIGGHYLPHYDWTQEKTEGYMGMGNRIATLMFYLSDVEQGGATVFPRLGVGVFPKKGSAIFWYNLHHNGTGDDRTLHGACPVLQGSKWVANKWVREFHQEFLRPCELSSGSTSNDSK